jgi:hypothetical protein
VRALVRHEEYVVGDGKIACPVSARPTMPTRCGAPSLAIRKVVIEFAPRVAR